AGAATISLVSAVPAATFACSRLTEPCFAMSNECRLAHRSDGRSGCSGVAHTEQRNTATIAGGNCGAELFREVTQVIRPRRFATGRIYPLRRKRRPNNGRESLHAPQTR